MARAELFRQCVRMAWDSGHAFHHGNLEKSLEMAERIYQLAMAKAAKAPKGKR